MSNSFTNSWGNSFGESWGPISDIVNATAVLVASNYEIDDLSGQKLYPGEAVESYKGMLTRKKHRDVKPPRGQLRYRSKDVSKARFSEGEDVFITADIDPDDL